MEVQDIVRNRSELQKLCRKVKDEFTEVEKLRRDKELEWEAALRQSKGIYDTEIQSKLPDNASKYYPKYTRSKELPAISKINSIVFPEVGRNWNIEPTPKPKIVDPTLIQTIQQQALAIAQQGQEPDIDQIVMNLLEDRKNNMIKTMSDQLVEMDYEDIIKKVIRSGVRYGTGIWKGPLSKPTKTYNSQVIDGQFVQEESVEYLPDIQFVPIWRFYPDMSTSEPNEMHYCFEHHCVNKRYLRELAEREDFFGEYIEEYINLNPDGDYVLKNWETAIQAIKDGKDLKNLGKGNYEMLEYYGYVDGKFLKHAGIEGTEDLEEGYFYEVLLFTLGQDIIKIVQNPLAKGWNPYNLFYYEKDESSIFGDGLPTAIRGTAISIAACSRMILDNAASVSGPQVEVNVDLTVDDSDIESIYPRKIWYREGRGQEAQYPAVRQISFDSHMQEYIQIISLFKQFGDEESTLPSFIWGDSAKTSNETAKGMSIKSSNVNLTMMDIIKSFDKANRAFIEALYEWNKEFNEDPEIVGDFTIKAMGSSSIMAKEVRNESMNIFASYLTPDDEPYIKRLELLKDRLEVLDLDAERILRSEEEAQGIIESRQDKEAEALAKEKVKAELEYERAKASNMFAKAEETVVDTKLKKIEAASGVKYEQGNQAR